MQERRVLLTGANGFIGSHLLEALIKLGYKVSITKRKNSDLWRIKHLLGKFESFNLEEKPLQEIFSGRNIDCVIHLATHYKKQDSPDHVAEMLYTNVAFPSKILDVAKKNGVKAFINTGTFFEMNCDILPINETVGSLPFNFYAETKIQFEETLKKNSQSMCVNSFKLFSPFGEKDNPKLVRYIIENGIEGREITLSEGLQKIDLIYIRDIISAYIKALERAFTKSFQPEYEVFCLGSGFPYSVRDVVSLVEENLGKRLAVHWGEKRADEIAVAYADISKAKGMLNWTPECGVKQGLTNTVSYYKKRHTCI
ncbi:NAD(P)-dependent oxidoreductase [Alphaproteobacteria bacterium]|nr:NAD(P)-dependent oxidoreductase [Alphaproteobacteria bacterium]